jgi:hypothetical protein
MKKSCINTTALIIMTLIFLSLLQGICSQIKAMEPPTIAPSFLQPGDMMFIETKHELGLPDFNGWDHSAIYRGGNLFIQAVPYPVMEVVRVSSMWEFTRFAADVEFAYVKTASPSQRLGALNFALEQVGQPFQWPDPEIHSWWANADPDDPDDPWSDWWYCSELLWASYLNQGINIDVTPYPPPPEEGGDGIHLFVPPIEIALDDDVELYSGGEPPYQPSKPSGQTDVKFLQTCVYTTAATDPEDDDVYYQWDWGEYQGPWFLVPRASGRPIVRPHTWLTLGEHTVRVRAKDTFGNIGDWSEPVTVTVSEWFGGGGGSSCFLAGSQVTMADNSLKNIEDITIGDIVLSYNLLNQTIEPAQVTQIYHHDPDEMPEYYLKINTNIKVTPNHLLYINGSLIQAGNASIGDYLIGIDNSYIPIETIEPIFEQVPTYNFDIEPPMNIYIIEEITGAYPTKPGSYQSEFSIQSFFYHMYNHHYQQNHQQ